MFNYRDLPEVEWDGAPSVEQLVRYIRAGEAVILSLSETSRLHVDPEQCGCAVDPESGVVYDCDAACALGIIAETNHLNGFEPVLEAAAGIQAKADIDAAQRRIVLHR